MSKSKQPTPESLEALAELKAHEQAPPVPVPAQVPIGDCLGRAIVCPQCGKDASVTHARGARTHTQVISSKWWTLVRCKGYCGAFLCKVGTPVTVAADPEPEVITKTLGEVVGRFILCPHPKCGAKAVAAWNLDIAHNVQCGSCGTRAYASETIVEVVG